MRASRLAGLAMAICGCAADHYGAYLHITAAEPFDHVEFVFGGLMPSDACDGSLDFDAAVVRRTPAFDNTTPSLADTMFRRQFAADDIRVIAAAKEYTYYVAVPENDPANAMPFPDDLGATVFVIATTGPASTATAPLVGELDAFTVPTDSVDKYEIPLHHPAEAGGELERWGGGQERCLRYTRPTAINGLSVLASKFIVPTWDRDCDGFFDQPCFTSGDPIDDDCDPLSYCDISSPNPDACIVPGGCVIDTGTAPGCRITSCTNQANHPTKLCGAAAPFCVDELACTSPPTCNRPIAQCVALELPPDITCDVPVLRRREEAKEGTLCTVDGVRASMVMLADQPTLVTCMVVEAVAVLATRTFGVTFATPSAGNGCKLEISTTTSPPPGFLPETRLLVTVAAGANAGGSVIVEVKPEPVDDCATAPAPVCQPTNPPIHTCPL